MAMGFEEAGLPETHCREEVRTQATASPVMGLYVKVELLAPAFVPFTFHWYAASGPPLTAAAENVTDVPMQKGLEEAEMETLAGGWGLTVMIVAGDVAGLPVAHVSDEERVQLTASLFAGTKE